MLNSRRVTVSSLSSTLLSLRLRLLKDVGFVSEAAHLGRRCTLLRGQATGAVPFSPEEYAETGAGAGGPSRAPAVLLVFARGGR